MKKIFITGGHATPALAVIEVLKKRNYEIYYVGRLHALEGDEATSVEYDLVTQAGIPFLSLTAGRLQRRMTIKGLVSLFKIPLGFIQSLMYLDRYKPDIILTFGGYVGLPVSWIGTLLRIPVVLHEQTRSPGLSNRLVARFARAICVSWPGLEQQFSHTTVHYTGNPLRSDIYQTRKAFIDQPDKPLMFIAGGNLGSHTINDLVSPVLKDLLEQFTVIHQTGDAREFKDYEKMVELKSRLPSDLRLRYYPVKFVGPEYIGWVYKQVSLMVSRSGANTVFETIALQIPCIFIPLAWAADNEQQKNAEYLEQKQAAMVLAQDTLTSQELLHQIYQLFEKREQIKRKLLDLQVLIRADAASQIADVIESVT